MTAASFLSPLRCAAIAVSATLLTVTAAVAALPPQSSSPGEPSPTRPGDGAPTSKPTAKPTKPSKPGKPGRVDDRPNFVLVLTDDQRADDMDYMPFTRRLVGGHGVTFTDGLSPHPLCCPARAELITGQYGQNSGVTHNSGPTGGFEALLDSDNTLPVWLQDAGYSTAVSGKYLNGWKPYKHDRPAGWTRWNPSIRGIYSYTHTTFFNDGRPEKLLGNADDHIVDYTNRYIREFARADKPFFVQATALAPHVYVNPRHGSHFAIPAKRHRGMFADEPMRTAASPAYRTPIVDGPISPDPGLTEAQGRRKFRSRIESLQAVDEGVKSIVKTLRATGELDNTYLIFASDNGNHLGEHDYWNKNTIFEEALRVPLLVRVPDTAAKGAKGSKSAAKARTSAVPATLVDIPATILDLAGVAPRRMLDGASFAALLTGKRTDRTLGWRDTQLIQTGTDLSTSAEPGWDTRGVRTARWTYAESPLTGMVQLYDRRNDPHQTTNRADDPAYADVVADLAARLAALRVCAGETCRRDFGPDPVPAA